ncbi:nuclear transport factor 2 family protein [Phyllobacterium sp. K27]
MQLSKSNPIRSAVFAFALLIHPGLQTGAAVASQDVTLRNKQIVTEAFDAWAAGGQTFFTDVLSPDVNWKIEGSGPSAGLFQGRDAFVERAVRPFVSRLSKPVTPVSKKIWADGEHVIINWEGVAVAGDGVPYSNSYAWIFRMQDGKAVEVNAFLDLAPYDDVIRRVPVNSN